MKLVKQYGRPTAAGFAVLGLLSLILAFTLFSHPVTARIWVMGEDLPATVALESPIAANWLIKAGIRLFPGDSLQYSGVRIPHSFELPNEDGQNLVYQPAFPITLNMDGKSRLFYSSAPTLGAALWAQGIRISAGDEISIPEDTPVNGPLVVDIRTGRPLEINIGGVKIKVQTAADIVGEALAAAGVALQNMDFSIPGESQPIPTEREVYVVRVREETVLEDSMIPYAEERVPDSEMAVGTERVLQTGQNGLRSSRIRVRYENGEEISRSVEVEWVSKQTVSQKTAYGTKVVLQTSSSSECPVDYWLEKEVKIYSYLDTGSKTASGIWPYKGVVAVSEEWYSILQGTNVCIPGYGIGTILDICGACAGKPLIDVFYPTEEYIPWNRTETIYFLPPVPDGFSGDLP